MILKESTEAIETAAQILGNGGVCILPTDTLYGICARASDPSAVEKVYELKKRNPSKAPIILISSLEDLDDFGVVLNKQERAFLESLWPREVSVALHVLHIFDHLPLDDETLAFRIPNHPFTEKVVQRAGPIIAPSANREGEPTAENTEDAVKVFGESIDLYVDGGRHQGKASTLIKISNGNIHILREGVVPARKIQELWEKSGLL